MKLFVFLIFAGCAVKCDESGNYYVIERPSDEPSVRNIKPFQVYWNVPTFQCKSKKVIFENLFEKYGIIQNHNDKFQGEQITILYDPGLFPAILQEENSGKLRTRNGGVPQEGNLDEHLTAFRYVVDQSIPDPEFSGIGIIDFESWRPIFRQNFWGVLTPYRNLSLAIERQRHPWWTNSMIEKEAKFRFERAGREFMQATVALARLLRPRAKWGYYGFPYCFNMAGAKPAETCTNNVQKENDHDHIWGSYVIGSSATGDVIAALSSTFEFCHPKVDSAKRRISWLWAESTALYPSVYSSKSLTASQLASLIRGRVAESARVGRGAPILPYFWFKYRDAGFMAEVDLKTALKTMYKSQTSGLILWGSSNDVNTLTKCEKLKKYLEQTLGPEIAKYAKEVYTVEEAYVIRNDTEIHNVSTQNPFDLMTSDSKGDEKIQTVVSDSDETKENNSENFRRKFDDEMMSTTNNSDSGSDEKNILIDIVLSLFENIQNSDDDEEKETTMKKIIKDRKKGTPIHDTFTNIDNDSDFTTTSPNSNFRKKGALFTLLYTIKNTTTPNDISISEEISTTDNNFDLIDKFTTFYNQDTFLDGEFNYTIPNTKTTQTDDYNDDTTVPFDHNFDYTTFTPSTTKSMVGDFDKGQNSAETSYTYIYTENTTDPNETTTENAISTTEKTTTDTGAYHDDVNDDFDYQVVINLE